MIGARDCQGDDQNMCPVHIPFYTQASCLEYSQWVHIGTRGAFEKSYG